MSIENDSAQASERGSTIGNMNKAERAIHENYYEKYKVGLGGMLQSIPRGSLSQAMTAVERAIYSEEDLSAAQDWLRALRELRAVQVRDPEAVYTEIAKSPGRLEALLSAQRNELALGTMLGDWNLGEQLKEAVIQLVGVCEHLAMSQFPQTMQVIEQRHRARDAKEINRLRMKMRDKNIT